MSDCCSTPACGGSADAKDSSVPGLRESVLAALEEKKPVVLADLAARFGVSEREAARALPADRAAFAYPCRFEEVWAGLVAWEKGTFIMQNRGSVLEFKGRIPAGSFGHGYFNLHDDACPLGGHIKIDGMSAIVFLSVPFMGLESHSVQFFDADGASMFGIYAGREGRTLIPAVRESFFALRGAVCETTA